MQKTRPKSQKSPLTIGISGTAGSFSEEAACTHAAKAKLHSIKIDYLVTVENVLAAVEKGELSLGAFRIENSNAATP